MPHQPGFTSGHLYAIHHLRRQWVYLVDHSHVLVKERNEALKVLVFEVRYFKKITVAVRLAAPLFFR